MVQEAVNSAMTQRKQIKKAQPKRLTESRLMEMIKESVKMALRGNLNEYVESSFKVVRCNEQRDKEEVCRWWSETFGDSYETVMEWLTNLSMNWELSVKAVDENGETAGFLIMSDYNIEDETESIVNDEPELLNDLNKLKYIGGFGFVISPKYRGSSLHLKMIRDLADVYKNYDFIFIPVRHELRTHNYWKRMGAIFFYQDEESKYYLIPQNDKVIKILQKHGII